MAVAANDYEQAGELKIGQVGIANHATIADGVRLGGQSGVKGDLREPGEYLGYPARPIGEEARMQVAYQQGPETLRAVRRLEKRVAELEARLAALQQR